MQLKVETYTFRKGLTVVLAIITFVAVIFTALKNYNILVFLLAFTPVLFSFLFRKKTIYIFSNDYIQAQKYSWNDEIKDNRKFMWNSVSNISRASLINHVGFIEICISGGLRIRVTAKDILEYNGYCVEFNEFVQKLSKLYSDMKNQKAKTEVINKTDNNPKIIIEETIIHKEKTIKETKITEKKKDIYDNESISFSKKLDERKPVFGVLFIVFSLIMFIYTYKSGFNAFPAIMAFLLGIGCFIKKSDEK